MPVNYTGNHELLGNARDAVISALEQYSSHEDLIDIDAQEKLEALAYAFGECVLLAMDTDDQGKAQANFTISTATQLAYLDSITPDEED
tara:strand:- start:2155 stop:2421 length:267 start_codon:yes stop_codon:yes gene_type:complete